MPQIPMIAKDPALDNTNASVFDRIAIAAIRLTQAVEHTTALLQIHHTGDNAIFFRVAAILAHKFVKIRLHLLIYPVG